MFVRVLKLPYFVPDSRVGVSSILGRIMRVDRGVWREMAAGRDVKRDRTRSSYSESSGGSRPSGRRVPGSGQSNIRQPARNRSSAPVDMSGELAQFVREAISQDQVVIFSKTYCPYCTMAKDVFKKMEKPYTVIELDKRNDGNAIQDILKEMTGARTVPRVFLNGECIGGGTDVQSLYEKGTLQNMIVKKV